MTMTGDKNDRPLNFLRYSKLMGSINPSRPILSPSQDDDSAKKTEPFLTLLFISWFYFN
jgi:hypothetical protein